MGELENPNGTGLSRRALLQGIGATAIAMAARPILGQQELQHHLPPGMEPKTKGPLVYLDYDQEELDLAYNQLPWAPNLPDISTRRAQKDAASALRLDPPSRLAYGPSELERLDFYPTDRSRAPIVVFIHGGAWRSPNPPEESLTQRAPMAASAEMFGDYGAHFAFVHFTNVLAAGGDLTILAGQVRRAVAWIYENATDLGADPSRIHVAGHSSGGHLAAVVLTTDWPREFGLPPNVVRGGLFSSGMYDLYPVSLSARRDYVSFTPGVVERLSPLNHLDKLVAPVIVTHGTLETPEFKRQNREFDAAVRSAGKPVQFLVGEGHNHFEILETFSDPYGLLGRAALEQVTA